MSLAMFHVLHIKIRKKIEQKMCAGRHIKMWKAQSIDANAWKAQSFVDGTVNVWWTVHVYGNAGASKAQYFIKSTVFPWLIVDVWWTAHSNIRARKAQFFVDGTLNVRWIAHCNASASKAQSFVDGTVFRWQQCKCLMGGTLKCRGG